jgi:hypothetical protein
MIYHDENVFDLLKTHANYQTSTKEINPFNENKDLNM